MNRSSPIARTAPTWAVALLLAGFAALALHIANVKLDSVTWAAMGALFAGIWALTLDPTSKTRLNELMAEQATQGLRFHCAINNITQGLCFFDGQQRLIVCNDRYAQMYKLARKDIPPGITLREVVDLRFAAGTSPAMTRDEYLQWRSSIAVSNKASDTLATLKDGRIFAIHHEPMPDGGWVATHEDITEQRRAQAQIERMAHHDALTSLPNRVLFRQRLVEALGQSAAGEPLAVLFIDIDRFKAVNDTLGHPVGDELLQAMAQRLCECVRQGDLVARLGGDEFAIIQQGAAQPAAARSLAERLVQAAQLPFDVAGHAVVVGASVGVALAPAHGNNPDELLKKADLALYDAKAAGRGSFSFFQAKMDEHVQGRRLLEIDLRQAAGRGELEIHYQPIVCLHTQRIVTVEALLRWRHPTRGLVMPDRFIPLAEETGLMDALGEWVLHTAFAQAMLWPPHVNVAVNLSPTQLRGGQLVRVVTSALRASGLAPSRVELEITESVRLAEDSVNLNILRQLHGLGLRISLDDFGVGYSSLSYLRSFPFKKIKIDRSFVRDVVGNAEAQAIVKAITTLGLNLDMAITAEGVETAEQLEILRGLGCDEAQGYHLCRPQPADEVTHMLSGERRLTLVVNST